jgi:hypothetical protein
MTPPSPLCIECSITTVIVPAFESNGESRRVFVAQCPGCGHANTYSLNNGVLRKW